MIKDLFKKEEASEEEQKPIEKKPQKLAIIVDTEDPIDVFPEEQI